MRTTDSPIERPALIDGETAASVELRCQIRDATARIARLAADRRALEEVRADLLAEEEALARQIAAAERERDRVAGKADEVRRRTEEIEQQIAGLELEIPLLEKRCKEQSGRSEVLARENEAVDDDLFTLRREWSTSEVTLRTLKDSLVRFDHRLKRQRRSGD